MVWRTKSQWLMNDANIWSVYETKKKKVLLNECSFSLNNEQASRTPQNLMTQTQNVVWRILTFDLHHHRHWIECFNLKSAISFVDWIIIKWSSVQRINSMEHVIDYSIVKFVWGRIYLLKSILWWSNLKMYSKMCLLSKCSLCVVQHFMRLKCSRSARTKSTSGRWK